MPLEHDGREQTCDEHGSACGEIAMERLRYFNGRYLNARDFRDEQRFHLSRHYLHNRLLHGWGVVCGLRVVAHPDGECRREWVKVTPGIAIDCCGREIVVRETVPVRVPKQEEVDAEGGGKRLYLCLRFLPKAVECVPVLDPESACDDVRKEHSRVRETHELRWIWLDAKEAQRCGAWRHDADESDDDEKDDERRAEQVAADAQHGQASRPKCDDDCDDASACLESCCPEHHCLLLARVTPGHEEPVIDMEGRRTLPPPGDHLTHIAAVNWPHGGTVTISKLRSELRTLRVTFDRRLAPHDNNDDLFGPKGVSPGTFRVEFGSVGEDIDSVGYRKLPRVEKGRVAVYKMNPLRGRDRNFEYLVNTTVFITLLCDFIEDCRGDAVDGDFVSARFPTGDGRKGGTFRSWFHVVEDSSDHEHFGIKGR